MWIINMFTGKYKEYDSDYPLVTPVITGISRKGHFDMKHLCVSKTRVPPIPMYRYHSYHYPHWNFAICGVFVGFLLRFQTHPEISDYWWYSTHYIPIIPHDCLFIPRFSPQNPPSIGTLGPTKASKDSVPEMEAPDTSARSGTRETRNPAT